MNEIQIFNNPQFGQVRTTIDELGKPLFCLADICRVLELTNPAMVKSRLSAKGISNADTLTPGGTQSMTYINDANLYRCIFQSRKPEAEKFQDWIFEDVIPSIQKHGAYATPQTIDNILADPANAIKLLQALQDEREQKQLALQSLQHERKAKQLAEAQSTEKDKVIGRLKPYESFVKTAFSSETLISMSQAAKILKLPFGRNTLYKKLRECGVFFSNKNEPKQEYVNRGYFRLVEGTPFETSKGLQIPVTVYCTQKGLAFINKLFGNNNSKDNQLAKIK